MRIANAHARAGMLMEREKERREEEIRKQLASENKVLANQQKSHLDYLDKEVYTNPPTAAYFMQFNTTTR
jgi:F0F1-type ATP synthase membrane subunit b/b'